MNAGTFSFILMAEQTTGTLIAHGALGSKICAMYNAALLIPVHCICFSGVLQPIGFSIGHRFLGNTQNIEPGKYL